jgi:hypothetical protein
MKYLSTQQFSTVIIQDRAAIRFVVPVELAVMIFWFLANRPARLTALMAWAICQEVTSWYSLIFDLAGWRRDLVVIRLAVLDLLGYRVAFA